MTVICTIGISLRHSTQTRASLVEKEEKDPPLIEIRVTGAVRNPSIYTVQPGTCLRKILKTAKIKREANLEELYLNKPLIKSEAIEIPARRFFCVYITGEVENPGRYEVPIETRICDLKKILILTPSADKRVFKSKKRVKHEEKILIPKA